MRFLCHQSHTQGRSFSHGQLQPHEPSWTGSHGSGTNREHRLDMASTTLNTHFRTAGPIIFKSIETENDRIKLPLVTVASRHIAICYEHQQRNSARGCESCRHIQEVKRESKTYSQKENFLVQIGIILKELSFGMDHSRRRSRWCEM